MKSFIGRLAISCLLIPVNVSAQSINQQTISTKIQEVTVFINGAEITDTEYVLVKKGRNTLIFNGLSPFLNTKSVQVSADNVEMLSVSTEDARAETDVRIKMIQDSIRITAEQIELIHNQVDALLFEKKMLTGNQRLGGSQTGVSLTELSKAADFFRDRTLKINNALTTYNKKIKILDEYRKTLEVKYSAINGKINSDRKQIMVVISSVKDQPVNFRIR